ncbi:MAG: hypothetical protein HY909_28310 [Deltaproteobacteria bacterium]|nr:hypothetical protein [Deltaproteobacteria bacterium]
MSAADGNRSASARASWSRARWSTSRATRAPAPSTRVAGSRIASSNAARAASKSNSSRAARARARASGAAVGPAGRGAVTATDVDGSSWAPVSRAKRTQLRASSLKPARTAWQASSPSVGCHRETVPGRVSTGRTWSASP